MGDIHPVVAGPWSDVFVGRTGEVDVLGRLVAAAVAAGRGGSVYVEGEAGIGKSAVLAAGLSQAGERGCQLFWCAADAARERLPLRALADGLGVGPDELLPADVTTRLDPGDDPVPAMVKSLLDRVDRICARAPTVLVLDDLHNADDATLLVWNRLSRSLGQLPLLLAAAARPVSRRAEVAGLRRTLLAGGTVGLSLDPLSDSHVIEVVGRLVDAGVGTLLRRSVAGVGGNPLFVREAVDAWRREGRLRVERGVAELLGDPAAMPPPMSLAAAIDSRLRSLAPEALSLLRWAALLGPEFAAVDLAPVAGLPTTEVVAAVESACTVGVLAQSGPRLTFRHPLLRQVLYEAIPPGDRAALYRRAARSLADAGAPVERVARLLVAVPPPMEDWTLDWLAGAEVALTLRAPTVAAELIERAVEGMPLDDPRRERPALSLATVLRLLARYDDVERVARPLLDGAVDPVHAGQAAWVLVQGLRNAGRFAEALEVTDRALRPDAGPWMARLRAVRAVLIENALGRTELAVRTAHEAVAEGERTGDRFAIGYGLYALGFCVSDAAESLAYLKRGLGVVADHPEGADLRLLMYANVGRNLRVLGRPAGAEQTLREALVLAERTGTARQLTLRSAACNNYYYLGRWDDVLVEMDVLLELLEEGAVAAYEHMHIHGYGALVAAHRDDRATLDGHVSAVRDRLSEPRLVRNTHNLREALALAAEQDGRLEDVFLSPRTVQSHVSHILTKLDARSRVEIGRAVARH